MPNYVQVRFQTSSSSTTSINHDFRLSKVNYLRDDMFHNKWQNQYFGYDPKVVKINAKASFDEYNMLYSDNHFAKYGKHRKITKGKQSDYLTGVVTLSNSVNDRLASGELSKDELEQCFIESLDRVKFLLENHVEQEVEIFSSVIHYDEKTPHMHFAFSNHTDKGQAVYHMLRTSKNKVLSKCQDEVGKAFKKIGFVRGEVKDKTNSRHKSVREMHQVEISILNTHMKELQEKEKELLEKFKQEQLKLKEQIKELQEQKKQIKSHVRLLDSSALDAKSELDNIDIKIKEIREAVKFDNHLMNDVKHVLQQYEENDIDGAVSELISRIKRVDLINNPNYKMEVSEMLSRFNKRRLLNIEEESEFPEVEQDIDIDNFVHDSSNVMHRKNR
ncbi:MAG TPA: plasmid recombination protein [Sulfurimonas sp.]|uniref:plasmid recombination protein n=1 Tax=Sulfurimonas sp. TaxID=2022749 RepID=UPI002CBF4EBC|nr:plasmid recombination protein [Sulfurimonas sp.]HUH43426.1 plasmid recombination protein [Sulfurimonas sp.]